MRYAKRITFFLAVMLLAACGTHHKKHHYLGYIEGQFVYLSSPVSGTLTHLAVKSGQSVKAKQLAFRLDPEPEKSELSQEQADLKQAEHTLKDLKKGERKTILSTLTAQVKQAKAQLVFAKKMYERNARLINTNAVSHSDLDETRERFDSAKEALQEANANLSEAKLGARRDLIAAQEAAVHAAKAQVSETSWRLAQKTVRFSKNGFVQDTLFRQHEFVPMGKPVIQFLPRGNERVIFYVPQRRLAAIKMGQTIRFTCDECNKYFNAKIEYISEHAEYTPPVIYSQESREKLVFKIEARMSDKVEDQMHPGLPVEVTL